METIFGMVSEDVCTICLNNFQREYGKCVNTIPLFSETSSKEFSNHSNVFFLNIPSVTLVEFLLQLRIVVIQDSEDGKGLFGKNALGK